MRPVTLSRADADEIREYVIIARRTLQDIERNRVRMARMARPLRERLERLIERAIYLEDTLS